MTALAAGAVLLGAALQSATGFGFALVAAPLLFALLGPETAVSTVTVLGLGVNVLTLASEGRRPVVLRDEAVALVAWAVPGLALGAFVLTALPDRALAAIVAVAVLAALAVRLRSGPLRAQAAAPAPAAHVADARRLGAISAPARPPAHSGWRTAVAGAAAGALGTSTGLSGPPLVLHLLARDATPAQLRDTLAAVFLALGVLSAAALVVAGAFTVSTTLIVLAAAGVAGHLLGRRVFARLGVERHERVILAVLGAAALAALASSVL